MKLPEAPSSPRTGGAAPSPFAPGRPRWLPLLLIAVATALAYSNALGGSFHFDDASNIVENPAVRELHALWPPTGNRWIGYATFALNHRLGGLEPFGYHLVNVLIHAGNALLVHWLVGLTLRTPALRSAEAGTLLRRYLPLTAALLFALHPVQTEAVTYVVQRFASLATLFFLLSLALYAKARIASEEPPAAKRRGWAYGLSIAAAVAAMRTKEISFTLPVAAAAWELLLFRGGRRLRLVAPMAAAALLVPLGLLLEGKTLADVLGDAGRFAEQAPGMGRWTYLVTQPRVVVTYLRLLLLPVGQNLDYDYPPSRSLGEPDVLLAIAILAAVVALAVFLLRRATATNGAHGRLVFFGVAWFFVTLSVESSIIPIRDVIFEHRLYLPAVGAALAGATALLWGLERLPSAIALGMRVCAALLVVCGPLGAATWARNRVWKDDLTLWSDTVARSPRKARPHGNLGAALLALGRTEEAIRECREAIRLDPAMAEPHDTLGLAYAAKGEYGLAIGEHRQAIRRAPWVAAVHFNLANAYVPYGLLEDAIAEYREAIRLAPSHAGALDNLGGVLLMRGRAAESVEARQRAFALTGGPETAFNLATSLEAAGRAPEAIGAFRFFLDRAGERYPDRAAIARRHVARLEGGAR